MSDFGRCPPCDNILPGSRPVGHLREHTFVFCSEGHDSIEFLGLDDTAYRALYTDRAATCEALSR
jgi:hypothetical protein